MRTITARLLGVALSFAVSVTVGSVQAQSPSSPASTGRSSSPQASASQGQAAAEPKTVAECLQVARSYAGRRVQELRAAGQTPDYAKLTQEAADLAGQYAARFSVATVATADLTPLARLYALAKQPALAQQALARHLATPGIADREKADALVVAVDVSMGPPVTDEGVKQAEAFAVQLDAMKGVELQRLQAHARLGGYYRGADVDDKIFAHASAVIDLAKALSPADRKAMLWSIASAYTNLAEVYGGWEQADKAIGALEQGTKDLGDSPDAAPLIRPTLERYRLVGTMAAPIVAPHWLNAPAGTSEADVTGAVTIVEFTAHWCGPCRKSYPAILRLHNAWAPRGLQVVFATELYGFLGQQRPLTPEQEIAADRRYFTEEHGVPFKIAIENQPPATRPTDTPKGPETNSDRYKVGGIPQIVVIDRQGKIRLIVVGWDPAAEARLNKLVERLLAEPPTKGD